MSIRFHSTGDARKALELFDGVEVNGLKLDVQVPERFRCDLDPHREARRSSASINRYGSHNQYSRHSFTRNNSMRKARTMSNSQGDVNTRRSSIFSPQDARSDLPDLPEAPTQPAAYSQFPQKMQSGKQTDKFQQTSPKKSNNQQKKKKKGKSGESQTALARQDSSSGVTAPSESG